MCDPNPVRNWLLAILAAILVAIGLIVVAAVTNGSFWYAWQSPGWMLGAAVATYLAVYFCGQAATALATLCRCTGERCAGPCNNLSGVLTAAKVVLGIQGAACLATAAYAWIPGVAQPSMWVIVGTLFLQASLLISAIAFFANLASCARSQ